MEPGDRACCRDSCHPGRVSMIAHSKPIAPETVARESQEPDLLRVERACIDAGQVQTELAADKHRLWDVEGAIRANAAGTAHDHPAAWFGAQRGEAVCR